MKAIGYAGDWYEEVPSYVKDFYWEISVQRSPDGHKMKDLGEITFCKEDNDYYVVVPRKIWKDPSEISYPPEDEEDYNPRKLADSVAEKCREELDSAREVNIDEVEDFYEVTVVHKVEAGEGDVVGSMILEVLPYDY